MARNQITRPDKFISSFFSWCLAKKLLHHKLCPGEVLMKRCVTIMDADTYQGSSDSDLQKKNNTDKKTITMQFVL